LGVEAVQSRYLLSKNKTKPFFSKCLASQALF